MNKRTIKFSAIVILIAMLTGVLLSACKTDNEKDGTSAVETVASETVTTDNTAYSSSAADDQIRYSFSEKYLPTKACDENGNSVDLGVVYGTYYTAYGGSISFEDDKFTAVFSAKGAEKGTVSVDKDGSLELHYESGKAEKGSLVLGGAEGDAYAVIGFTVTQGDFTVTFAAS